MNVLLTLVCHSFSWAHGVLILILSNMPLAPWTLEFTIPDLMMHFHAQCEKREMWRCIY